MGHGGKLHEAVQKRNEWLYLGSGTKTQGYRTRNNGVLLVHRKKKLNRRVDVGLGGRRG